MIKLITLENLVNHMKNNEADNLGIINIKEIKNGIEVQFYNKFENIDTYYEHDKKPTIIEESDYTANLETKINWMLSNGFKENYCSNRKVETYDYKFYSWTKDEVDEEYLDIIKKYRDYYDYIITENELDKYIEERS
jgi:hypothetical protein